MPLITIIPMLCALSVCVACFYVLWGLYLVSNNKYEDGDIVKKTRGKKFIIVGLIVEIVTTFIYICIL